MAWTHFPLTSDAEITADAIAELYAAAVERGISVSDPEYERGKVLRASHIAALQSAVAAEINTGNWAVIDWTDVATYEFDVLTTAAASSGTVNVWEEATGTSRTGWEHAAERGQRVRRHVFNELYAVLDVMRIKRQTSSYTIGTWRRENTSGGGYASANALATALDADSWGYVLESLGGAAGVLSFLKMAAFSADQYACFSSIAVSLTNAARSVFFPLRWNRSADFLRCDAHTPAIGTQTSRSREVPLFALVGSAVPPGNDSLDDWYSYDGDLGLYLDEQPYVSLFESGRVYVQWLARIAVEDASDLGSSGTKYIVLLRDPVGDSPFVSALMSFWDEHKTHTIHRECLEQLRARVAWSEAATGGADMWIDYDYLTRSD